MKLVICEKCNGTGVGEDCGDNYCAGHRCNRCNGRKEVLSPEDRKKKEELKELMKLLEYE